MANLTRDFFIGLSNSRFLNKSAQKWGFRFGAEKFVAGTDIDSVTRTIREMNARGISCTVDNLGEFVSEKSEAASAKQRILQMLDRIHEENLDCHISVKLTQLGLDIDRTFCLQNMEDILARAAEYGIFINIDMEDYTHFHATIEVLKTLLETYQNVGTVIQAYLRNAEAVMDELKDVRLRIVKGAYKESETTAFQSKAEIDRNYVKLVKKRLLGEAYTSIATHDHHIIRELEAFIEENQIPHSRFEFQMLYGFRQEMQYELAKKYHFTTYMPFGNDWFGYYMRRLAERPQNVNLIVKDVLYTKDNKLKKEPLLTAALTASLFMLWRRKRKR
ncbi:proline dehydrogenase family protein [Heyndrickxia coagulans]|uniref:proline dehydrogenase family protein n=1 Tax=Heyndrickxia coagulans TaxID=1398 RepID=UPI003D248956